MYKIVYHKLVLSKDFKKISKTDQRKILRAIHKKLYLSPDTFGKPLRGDLEGYYRLRIDHYRVIYRIKKKEVIVIVIHVGLRKDLLVYIETAKRLKESFKLAAKEIEIKEMADEGIDDFEEQWKQNI